MRIEVFIENRCKRIFPSVPAMDAIPSPLPLLLVDPCRVVALLMVRLLATLLALLR